MRRGLLILAVALAAVVATLAIALIPRREALAPTPSPSPVGATSTPGQPSPTGTATATPGAAGTPGPTARYVSALLGYAIDTPAPWRRSACFSSSRGSGPTFLARDVFVPVPERDERATDIGLQIDQVAVFARANPQGLTPRQWEEAGMIGGSLGRVLEDVTFAGRPALRARDGEADLWLVANGNLMLEVSHASGSGQSTASDRRAIAASFRFLSEDELRAARAAPTPQPPPPRSPEAVAQVLADGFARRDAALLESVIIPTCITEGASAGGAGSIDDQVFLERLRAAFQRGLSVTVRPQTLKGDRSGDLPTLMVESTWREPGQADREMDLMISPVGDTWYWRGTLFLPSGRR
jgi:hypothetical protein